MGVGGADGREGREGRMGVGRGGRGGEKLQRKEVCRKALGVHREEVEFESEQV